jgi:hypothetical protein
MEKNTAHRPPAITSSRGGRARKPELGRPNSATWLCGSGLSTRKTGLRVDEPWGRRAVGLGQDDLLQYEALKQLRDCADTQGGTTRRVLPRCRKSQEGILTT